jgi:diphthine-ammonia ligase
VQQDGGSAIMKIGGGHVVPTQPQHSFTELEKLRRPDLLDVEFHTILSELWQGRQCGAKGTFGHEQSSDMVANSSRFNYNTEPTISECTGQLIRISNIHCAHDSFTAAQQMQYIVDSLRTLLQRRWSLNASVITFSSLILRRMSDFDIVNAIYGSLFEKPNPPARVTIACGSLLPQGVDVILSITIEGYQTARRRGLHVQSRSYWAPANIGPYSQAIAVSVRLEASASLEELSNSPEMVYVAGQIPLIPRTMSLFSAKDGFLFDLDDASSPDFGFHVQSALSLQHLWRIGRAMSVPWWVGAVAFIAHCEEAKEAAKRAAIAILAWHKIHQHCWNKSKSKSTTSGEETGIIDVWDSRNNRMLEQTTSSEDDDTRQSLPKFSSIHTSASSGLTIPPCYVVEVQELPRGSDIEWLSAGFIADRIESKIVFESTVTLGYSHISSHGGPSVSYLGFRKASSIAECTEHLMSWIPSCSPAGAKAVNFFTVYIAANSLEVPWSYIDQLKAELVPCWRIWSYLNIELEALVVIHTRQQ